MSKTSRIAPAGREIIFVAMARPLRFDIKGGWYHVINRGLQKRRLFLDKRINLHFLELLSVFLPASALRFVPMSWREPRGHV
jgi:hypothetical protein